MSAFAVGFAKFLWGVVILIVAGVAGMQDAEGERGKANGTMWVAALLMSAAVLLW